MSSGFIQQKGLVPLLFFYSKFHDSIRTELDEVLNNLQDLSDYISSVKQQQQSHSAHTKENLKSIEKKFKFLVQVYKYHSAAEDEVTNISI